MCYIAGLRKTKSKNKYCDCKCFYIIADLVVQPSYDLHI